MLGELHEAIRQQEGVKVCSECEETKPLESFYNCKRYGKQSKCKKCGNRYTQERRKKNPEEYRKYKRNRDLIRTYGITLDEADQLFAEQGHCCAICKTTDNTSNKGKGTTSFSVDHCHDTGEVRGLLCDPCNLGLGQLGDTEEALERALDYIKQSKEKQHE